MLYNMHQVSKQVDVPYERLKYYCKEGLVPNVKRDKNNYRVFDDRDVAWIKSLLCLKRCGMSIKEIRRYMELCMQGQSTIPERSEMLDAKRQDLIKMIADLQANLGFIAGKQKFYADVQAGKIEYYSNLIPKDK